MKVNFDRPILLLNGDPLTDRDGKPATLGDVVSNSLLADLPSDKAKGGEDKGRRFDMARRFYQGTHDVTPEEANKILTRLDETHNALIYGRAREILYPQEINGKENETEETQSEADKGEKGRGKSKTH